jgi:hypothetical protein
MSDLEVSWPSRVPRLLFSCRLCPLCSSIRFSQAEPGTMDRLLRCFGLKPVRCVNCWRRYYCFASKEQAVTLEGSHGGI